MTVCVHYVKQASLPCVEGDFTQRITSIFFLIYVSIFHTESERTEGILINALT